LCKRGQQHYKARRYEILHGDFLEEIKISAIYGIKGKVNVMKHASGPSIFYERLFGQGAKRGSIWKDILLASVLVLLVASSAWPSIPSCEISNYEFLSREIDNVPDPYRSLGLKIVRCYFFSKENNPDLESIYFQCLFKPRNGRLVPVGFGHVDDLIISRTTPMRTYLWRFGFDKDWRVNWSNYMEVANRMVEVAEPVDSESYRERIEELLKGIFIRINNEPYFELAI